MQELCEKYAAGAYSGKPLHFIGHLQTNKVRQVVGLSLIHIFRKGIAVILKVLLIVLHLIRSFAVGREGTGNGHVFGRHREAVFPAPAAERVARGRGVRCHCNSSAVFLGRLRRQLARADVYKRQQ